MHSEKTHEAAMKIINKIVKSRYPVAALTTKEGMIYMNTNSKRFGILFLNSPHMVIGVYDANVSNVDLMDDLAAAGVK
jgi:hypothetical protein